MRLNVLLSSVVIIVGCAQQQGQIQSNEYDQIGLSASASSACCVTLKDLNYEQVDLSGEYWLNINSNSQVVRLETGTTFAHGMKLPDADKGISVQVSSYIQDSVFVPSIVVLDSDYNVVDYIADETIQYQARSLLSPERYYGAFDLPKSYSDNSEPSYLLVITTDQQLNTKTPKEKPSQDAIRSGDVSANIIENTDAYTLHASTGRVLIDIDFDDSNTEVANQRREDSIAKVTGTSAPVALPVYKNETSTNAELSQNSEDMSAEGMINQLIVKSVKLGELEQALLYLEEANSRGYRSSKEVYLKALQSQLSND